jgi:hypothetical protein
LKSEPLRTAFIGGKPPFVPAVQSGSKAVRSGSRSKNA